MHTYSVKRGFDLRMPIGEKKSMAGGEVTFFVNNAHSLVHIVLDWSDGGNFREPIPKWLKGTNDQYLEQWLIKRYDWLLYSPGHTKTPNVPSEKDFTSPRARRHFLKVVGN